MRTSRSLLLGPALVLAACAPPASAPVGRVTVVAPAPESRPVAEINPASPVAGPAAASPQDAKSGDTAAASTLSRQIATAAASVAGLRGAFRSCYDGGLYFDPTMTGFVRLQLTVGPNGDVASVTPRDNEGLSTNVVACLVRKAERARFDPPGPDGATLQIPLTFILEPKCVAPCEPKK